MLCLNARQRRDDTATRVHGRTPRPTRPERLLLRLITIRRKHPMGYLIYDRGTTELFIDDRTLAHLQIVMLSKLRRHESFAFSWKDSATTGDGRSTIWITPTSSLRFRYQGSRTPTPNKAWVTALLAAASSSTGLQVIPEPAATTSPELQRRR
jgi:hypothetical protein